MARPRVFISSTFFDLRHVRADIERFIKELGYDSVRNETGGIPYGKDLKLEEYCYKEISEIDMLVGIVGGRFGTEAEREHYSITQVEIKTAIEQNKQVYIFIEKNVLSEYQTFLLNKDNENVRYRFVDDKRIYEFIEEINALPKNNVIHPFETSLDIVLFLREQWAGLFRDLLTQQTKKTQYENLSSKVGELNEVASTLQTYLENVLQNVTKEKGVTEELISSENKRLEAVILKQRLFEIDYIQHLVHVHSIDIDDAIDYLKESNSLSEFKTLLKKQARKPNGGSYTYGCLMDYDSIGDINSARTLLKLLPFSLSEKETKEIEGLD